jgi:hypothetical protein
MHVLAIDPGNEESAWVVYQLYGNGRGVPVAFAIEPNEAVRKRFGAYESDDAFKFPIDYLAIEMVASFGMAVGREVFETVRWIGRFEEAWNSRHESMGPPAIMVYRSEVKMHLCGNNTAKDSNIRCALVDRYGPGKEKAIGKKATPGPLYGISNDVWSALAIAVTWSDKFAASTLAVAG